MVELATNFVSNPIADVTMMTFLVLDYAKEQAKYAQNRASTSVAS